MPNEWKGYTEGHQHSTLQKSSKFEKNCLIEFGKMIKYCMRFQENFSWLYDFLPGLVWQSYTFSQHFCEIHGPVDPEIKFTLCKKVMS